MTRDKHYWRTFVGEGWRCLVDLACEEADLAHLRLTDLHRGADGGLEVRLAPPPLPDPPFVGSVRRLSFKLCWECGSQLAVSVRVLFGERVPLCAGCNEVLNPVLAPVKERT